MYTRKQHGTFKTHMYTQALDSVCISHSYQRITTKKREPDKNEYNINMYSNRRFVDPLGIEPKLKTGHFEIAKEL